MPVNTPILASITTIIVSVVRPLSIIMSSAIKLLSAPGARFSESNQESYLNMMPLISSFRTLAVSSSPVYPNIVRSNPAQKVIPTIKAVQAQNHVTLSVSKSLDP